MLIASFFRLYHLADHPLGLFFDPAINGLDAIRLMERGGHTLFFPTNGGRESLYIYLLIPFIWLFGTTPLAIRLLAAIISLLTVALLFAFLYDMKPLKQSTVHPLIEHRLWFAALSSLTLAISYWHIAISRLGARPILVILLSVPTFWLFLKGWQTHRNRWFILAGICLGLEGYTYSAARLLPVILGLALLPEFLRSIKRSPKTLNKKRIAHLAIFIGTAAVVYMPMGWFLLMHPEQFTARATSVMVWHFLDTPSEVMAELGRNLWRVLGFFCCGGNQSFIFGPPDYPGLSPLLSPFLIIGLIIALKNWHRLFYRLIAFWWLVGIIPSVIAIEAPHPLRMLVALVPTAILVGIAPLHLKVFHRPGMLWAMVLIILLSTPTLFRTYFIDWPHQQTTQGIYDYGAIAIRDTILAQDSSKKPIYLPLARFNDSPLLFYLSGKFHRQAALSVPPAESAFVIAPDRYRNDASWVRLQDQTATILPPLTEEGKQRLQTALSDTQSQPIQTPAGEIVAHMAPLSTDPAHFLQSPAQSLQVAFGPAQLKGVTYPFELNPTLGAEHVTLFWQARTQMGETYELILHLVDDEHQVRGYGIASAIDWAYPTSFWRPKVDKVAIQHHLQGEGTPLEPGRYWLAIALYDPMGDQRVPIRNNDFSSPDTYFVGPLKVAWPEPDSKILSQLLASPPVEGKRLRFGSTSQSIELAGLTLDKSSFEAGETIHTTLLWQAHTEPDRDYTVFIHLLDSEGQWVAGHDAQPLAGEYPTSIWSPDEYIIDPHPLTIPKELSAGHYHLAIGLYHQPTGERLIRYLNDKPDPTGQFILSSPLMISKSR